MELMADKLPKADPDREINEAWQILSKGGTYADNEMILTVFGNLGENIKDDAALQRVIEEADHDGDGKINYDDFYKTMKVVDEDLE
jgi:Ca2+-binding EF-hand superfamily protein